MLFYYENNNIKTLCDLTSIYRLPVPSKITSLIKAYIENGVKTRIFRGYEDSNWITSFLSFKKQVSFSAEDYFKIFNLAIDYNYNELVFSLMRSADKSDFPKELIMKLQRNSDEKISKKALILFPDKISDADIIIGRLSKV